MEQKKGYFEVTVTNQETNKSFILNISKSVVYSFLTFLLIFCVGFALLVIKSGQIAAKLQLLNIFLNSVNKLEYKKQIGVLKNTENELNNLTKFIDYQKIELSATKGLLDSLKKQKDTLSTIVNTDKNAVSAIISVYKTQARESFFLKLAVALLASIIVAILLRITSQIWKTNK